MKKVTVKINIDEKIGTTSPYIAHDLKHRDDLIDLYNTNDEEDRIRILNNRLTVSKKPAKI